jgi:hypothetical protein
MHTFSKKFGQIVCSFFIEDAESIEHSATDKKKYVLGGMSFVTQWLHETRRLYSTEKLTSQKVDVLVLIST